jgi:hypothetical protein
VNQSSWLSDTQRVERYQSLRQATARHEPPVITEAGLRLIRELAVSPQRPEASDEQLRPELERLVQAGVVGDDGSLRIDAEEFLGTMRWSDVQVQIEVGAGRSVRAWKAWIGYYQAIVVAQSSPAIAADDSSHDIAGRRPLTLDEYSLQVVTPGWVSVDAMHWLGFGPRMHPGVPCHLPLPAPLRRLTDPHTPPPHDDVSINRIWGQPMQMCIVTAEPTRDCVRLLDTGGTGVWVLNTEGGGTGGTASAEEVVTLTPLTPRALWHLFLTLTVSFSARQPDPSSAVRATGGHE